MREQLAHRGPDAKGEWLDADRGLALGHRRLSILDLSEEGAQPMVSATGRWVIAYNGEVYNFGAIRDELAAEGARFRGGSDTEVMLAAIEAFGLTAAVRRFVGMFAFALWDRHEGVLWLVRDRLGIKPLHWARATDGSLVFGSELKALVAHPRFDDAIDRSALAAYLRFNCVPAPHTIYRSARKVRPGVILRFSTPESEPSEEVYWSATDVAHAGLSDPFAGSEAEAADAVEAALRDSVRLRMIADVPLGAFLSGGIDSSIVVALMQSLSARPVRTFSIGNERRDYDEAESAGRVARHLGTEHTSLVVSGRDALDVVPELPRMFDEPFADSSQIPTYLVSRLARQHVTVSLSGDGGDELFGGYNRHFWGPSIWSAMRRVPRTARSGVGRALQALRPGAWDRVAGAVGGVGVRLPGQQVHKLAGVLDARDATDLYRRLCSHWRSPLELVLGASQEAERFEPGHIGGGVAEDMMLTDLLTYLPDDILTKVDRASMAVSLEARVPILDHRVVELAWRLPLEHKVRGREGKRVLRAVLARHVPRELWDRPKMGFGVPVGDWLRGPLRPWAEDLLAEPRLRREGVFDADPIRAAWREHLAGTRNWQHHLWDVLMFQAWHEGRATMNARSSRND